MKKIVALFLCVVMILSMSGCEDIFTKRSRVEPERVKENLKLREFDDFDEKFDDDFEFDDDYDIEDDYGIDYDFDDVNFNGKIFVCKPVTGPARGVSEQETQATARVIRQRLDALGHSDAVMDIEDDYLILIGFPGEENPDVDTEALGATSIFEFRDSNGNLVVDGTDLKNAVAGYMHDEYVVELFLTPEGRKSFAGVTSENIGKSLSVFIYGRNVSNPVVNETIDSDICVISGQFTNEDAEMYADLINAGVLPFSLDISSADGYIFD